jgi:GT2 family glycosyltransferase
MPSGASVTVIIVHLNSPRITDRCIRSLRCVNVTMDIVVVDNGSTDNSVAVLSHRHPDISIISTHSNLGFSRGVNTGIRRALAHKSEYLWILNNDTIVTRDALSTMLAKMYSDETIGLVGSTLIEEQNGCRVEIKGGWVNFFTGIPNNTRMTIPGSPIEYVKGASMLVRTEALRQVGLFDESFFLYWEDTDLCFRLRAQGWKLEIACDSIVYHQGQGSLAHSTPLWDYHFTRSSLLFFSKHATFPLLPIAFSATGRLVKRLMARKWSHAAAVLKALTGAAYQ